MRHAARPLVAVLAIAGFAAAASCLIRDPNHCAHNGGNADCTEAGFSYCSSCVKSTEHRGCVAEPPPDDCRADDGGVATAGTTDGPTGDGTAPTVGDDGSSTGAGDCTMNGAFDDACPAEAPYCLDGTCAGCDAADEGFCAGVDANLPVCGTAGVCVACSADDPGACTAEQFCSPLGVCGGCTSHDQCAPEGCESGTNACQACDFASGECFEGNVYWVSLDDCVAGSEEGTYEQPYCQVGPAMANVLNGQEVFTVRVLPSTSSYDGPVNLNASGNNRIAVVGHGGRPTFTGSTNTGNVTNLSNRLFLSRIVLEDATESTARCASGRLWLDDVIVRGGPVGVRGENCTLLSISNSVVTGAAEVGVGVTGEVGSSGLRIVNSSIVNNGSEGAAEFGGISISDVVGWTIDYSTVVGNMREPGVTGSGLFCSGSISGTVRNSIFLSGKGTEAISCFSADFASTVSDTPELPGEGNLHHVYAPSEFVNPGFGEAHLKTNADPDVFRIGVWRAGDPATDIDGDPRPLVDGAPDWAGFDAIP